MSLPRIAYTALVWLAMPLAALYLLWRSRRQPAYRAHWGERFGWARLGADEPDANGASRVPPAR